MEQVKEPRKTSRKEQIYMTATLLFRERGYASASMRDLARELKIEAPSLYSHIKSKEEMLRKICFDTANQFFKGLDGIEKNNFSAKSRLKAAMRSHVEVVCENLDPVAVFLNEWRNLSEPYLSDFVQMRKNYEGRFRSYIEFGVNKGEFSVTDVDFAVLTILSSMNWMYNWYRPDGIMTPRQIADNLSDILIKGIS